MHPLLNLWISHVVSVDGCFFRGHIPGWSKVQCQCSCAAFGATVGECLTFLEPEALKMDCRNTQLGFCSRIFTRSVPLYWKPNWPKDPSYIHTVLPDVTDKTPPRSMTVSVCLFCHLFSNTCLMFIAY